MPHRATWTIGGASAALSGLFPINLVAELTNIGVLMAFVLVSGAVLVLRYKKPDLPRGFRCPGMPVVPVLSIIFSIWLMSYLQSDTWLRLGGWLLLGLVIYVCYGYRRTRRVKPGDSVDLEDVQRLDDDADPLVSSAVAEGD